MVLDVLEKLEHLSPHDKRALADALLRSAEVQTHAPEARTGHLAELRERLARHRDHPDDPTITFAELEGQLKTGVR
jgi:hypothetical protein